MVGANPTLPLAEGVNPEVSADSIPLSPHYLTYTVFNDINLTLQRARKIKNKNNYVFIIAADKVRREFFFTITTVNTYLELKEKKIETTTSEFVEMFFINVLGTLLPFTELLTFKRLYTENKDVIDSFETKYYYFMVIPLKRVVA